MLAAPVLATSLAQKYREVRAQTERLTEPLALEDQVVQSMPDVSPTRWHLAHTTWFFETFVLAAADTSYRPFDPRYAYLFNSYYVQAGDRFPRAQRGLLTRPTVAEVLAYRHAIDERLLDLLAAPPDGLLDVIVLGLHHEQQHQELILTDIKHVLSMSPLRPVYEPVAPPDDAPSLALDWVGFDEGVAWIGHEGPGFAFDNEGPRHRQLMEAFELATRLVTVDDYAAFIADGGYRRPELWLSDGWNAVVAHGWQAPLYWERVDGAWWVFTLGGFRQPRGSEPVCHVSYYEADAFARWAGARLPLEAELELAARAVPVEGNLLDSGALHPCAASQRGLTQIYGDVWEWTASPYTPYPHYAPPPGALGEYNGKFMANQMVLRGGSCATPAGHIRPTYRNFFPPEARWQFTGIRLARWR